MSDEDEAVDSPAHYNMYPMECIDVLQIMLTPEEFLGYCKGNELKYRWRRMHKNCEEQDLKKADWYQGRYNEAKKNEVVAVRDEVPSRVKPDRNTLKEFCLALDRLDEELPQTD